MRYRSTRNLHRFVSLDEAVLHSLPPDRGLYVPESVPRLPERFWQSLAGRSFQEVAKAMAEPFFVVDLGESELDRVVAESLTFDAPLVAVAEGIHVLELWHGPTLAFKDFGARFMARTMKRLRQRIHDGAGELTVLVATSGDTGAAVAAGFHEVPGVRVWLLYPEGRVSPVQEKQLTTFGGNVKPLEVRGTFDDCQALVKQAFLDPELNSRLELTSANSINVARWIPQSFYYARACQQWTDAARPPTFCVPSGNLGNLCAGLLAQALGMPAAGFVAATNVNDAFVRYLQGRPPGPDGAHRTVSNAMDVAAPSNLERIEWLIQDHGRPQIEGHAVDDQTTLQTMARVHAQHGYILDPHTAVGWTAAERHRASHPRAQVVVLATAHPAKFPESVRAAIGQAPPAPSALRSALERPKEATPMEADFDVFRALLLATHR